MLIQAPLSNCVGLPAITMPLMHSPATSLKIKTWLTKCLDCITALLGIKVLNTIFSDNVFTLATTCTEDGSCTLFFCSRNRKNTIIVTYLSVAFLHQMSAVTAALEFPLPISRCRRWTQCRKYDRCASCKCAVVSGISVAITGLAASDLSSRVL